jgi:hypothetical protein
MGRFSVTGTMTDQLTDRVVILFKMPKDDGSLPAAGGTSVIDTEMIVYKIPDEDVEFSLPADEMTWEGKHFIWTLADSGDGNGWQEYPWLLAEGQRMAESFLEGTLGGNTEIMSADADTLNDYIYPPHDGDWGETAEQIEAQTVDPDVIGDYIYPPHDGNWGELASDTETMTITDPDTLGDYWS